MSTTVAEPDAGLQTWLRQHAKDRYVKANYGLEERGLGVTTTSVTRELRASAILGRLRKLHLIRHGPSFLIEALAYGWDEVEVEKLDHPSVDPHGGAISRPDGAIVESPGNVLATLDAGAAGRLVRVCNGESGARIEVLGRGPWGGPLTVRKGEPKEGRVHSFGAEPAELLSIEREP